MAKKKKTTTKKSLVDQRLAAINKALEADFMYNGVNCDYGESHCPIGCDCGVICRESVLTGAKVADVDLERVSEKFVVKQDKNSILHYAIERQLAVMGFYNTERWEVQTVCGYYGEEVSDVTMNSCDPEPFIDLVNAKNDLKRVHKILIAEYGYVLEELKPLKNVEIKKVVLDDVVPAQNGYVKKVSAGFYGGRNLPHCVCVVQGDRYRIIDGHHRYATARSEGLTHINIVLLS
jgi:hypothetical protein